MSVRVRRPPQRADTSTTPRWFQLPGSATCADQRRPFAEDDLLAKQQHPSSYGALVRKTQPPPPPPPRRPEQDLDNLLEGYTKANQPGGATPQGRSDPIQALRETTINVLIPVFVELIEKYSEAGISLQMDASNFLEGGREIKFEFGLGEYRIDLHGTVTTEAIAFHETRHSPDVHGELVSGPMLRLRGLDGNTFRDFVCERMAALIRSAMPRR